MINSMRHMSVFDPDRFGARRVDIVGCGALGSRVAISIAKLGIENIHVWDFDSVEAHNIANQAYGLSDVGKPKVDALQDIIRQLTGISLQTHNEKATRETRFGEIVLVLPDTMASRTEIWNAVKFKPYVALFIEGRMGADTGRVYTINPMDSSHIDEYEDTLYSDEKAEVSLCGSAVSVGPTAEFLSGLVVWQLIRWFHWLHNGEDEEDVRSNEIIFSLRPSMFLSKVFA